MIFSFSLKINDSYVNNLIDLVSLWRKEREQWDKLRFVWKVENPYFDRSRFALKKGGNVKWTLHEKLKIQNHFQFFMLSEVCPTIETIIVCINYCMVPYGFLTFHKVHPIPLFAFRTKRNLSLYNSIWVFTRTKVYLISLAFFFNYKINERRDDANIFDLLHINKSVNILIYMIFKNYI